MTTQDRINQLATAALRSAAPVAAPKPETFMPSFDRLRSAEFATPTARPAPPAAVSTKIFPMPAPEAAPATAPAPVAVSEPAAPAAQHQSDPELREMLDSRDHKRQKREKRANRGVTVALLVLLAAGGGWFATSPTAQGKAMALITAVKQSGKDVKSLGSIMGTYEQQLDKVAVQGARIDAASAALGVDPAGDTSAQGAAIDGGMKNLTGEGGGPTVAERDKALQAKFGIVQKLAKDKAPKVEKAQSDVKF